MRKQSVPRGNLFPFPIRAPADHILREQLATSVWIIITQTLHWLALHYYDSLPVQQTEANSPKKTELAINWQTSIRLYPPTPRYQREGISGGPSPEISTTPEQMKESTILVKPPLSILSYELPPATALGGLADHLFFSFFFTSGENSYPPTLNLKNFGVEKW